jgi:hypothetical protein
MTRNELAIELLRDCPTELLDVHEIIADAIRSGDALVTVLAMPEMQFCPDTYYWLFTKQLND